MTPPKPTRSLAGQKCPLCKQGKFAPVQIDHTEHIADDNPITIPNIWVDRCDSCGEIVFPAETTQFIESVVSEHTEQLTARELERIREDLGVAKQDDMSEILGLGSKTYHKWESGAQFPTRSMTYYIRVLAEFPDAFHWLRDRRWRKKSRIAVDGMTDWKTMFPDLPQVKVERTIRTKQNPALGLCRVAFASK
jgi:putative zinc finger/helix-turn-helix YgiT family protein